MCFKSKNKAPLGGLRSISLASKIVNITESIDYVTWHYAIGLKGLKIRKRNYWACSTSVNAVKYCRRVRMSLLDSDAG